MSGFEIAGVVLGTYPLLVSAAERYRRLITRHKDYKTRKIWSRLQIDLEFEERVYGSIMNDLFFGILAEEQQSDLLGSLQMDPTIAAKVNKRLEAGSEAVLRLLPILEVELRSIKESFESIENSLQGTKAGFLTEIQDAMGSCRHLLQLCADWKKIGS
ncbi:hypothetical protein ONS95_008846 [Cadophora gregata]|uniref:uncharacterized protein n=1 Tax=Cadophora gregata TaxID=51156 RepID=UPI0026DBD538|nr:uncharacterized protein ONS95_008846 [Cadophora gregata]KAK0123853.1 hypothetical protein ONS95_008846 [Cadophora gregata]